MIKEKKRIKGVIFDWNGVLSDDFPKVYAVTNKTLKKTGGRPFSSMREFREKIYCPWYPFYVENGSKATKTEIDKWYSYYYSRFKIAIQLFPDAEKTLSYLNNCGIKIGLVSSHITSHLINEAKEYGVLDYFDFVKGDAHTKCSHIVSFIKKFSFDSSEVVYIGDMVNDIIEGRKAGVITAAYTLGTDSRTKLLKYKPDIMLNNLIQIKKYI